ncbi:hypothetical protein MLD38_006768 [Melastoma candidum]|uniref:Uncharacterized protein n=1 Tax=Melastoma candidum TaxID=119954 RepID=A0ACB9RNG6_9MYRT|nr:hypothetical protein MLD38_006768 [Melastoma candidum]
MGTITSKLGERTPVKTFPSEEKWKEYFESSKSSDKLLVVDFHAKWCPPCQYIAPKFKELAAQHKDVDFVKIDVDAFKDVAEGFQVTAMPTFIFFKGGKELDRLLGADEDELKKKIDQLKKK